jgi:hypothetical protein
MRFRKNIPGYWFGKDSQEEGRVEKVVHLGEEGPGTELWAIGKTRNM